MLPFPALVLAVAILPIVASKAWSRHWFQLLVVLLCAGPVVATLTLHGAGKEVLHALSEYASFVCTLGALYVTAGGFYAMGNLEATPRTNLAFLLVGSLLASIIGTTGASVLMIRPFLRTNSERENTQHLVPFFILAVANAGGLLTPLGDPPLLVGFIQGVPFFWTLRLLPVWLLYVGFFAVVFYIIDRRAYANERPEARRRDHEHVVAFDVRGTHNLLWLLAIVGAAFLPGGLREAGLIVIGLASYFGTSRETHRLNHFSFSPIVEVAVLFAGLFACLVPVEHGLAVSASRMPLQASWQLFWASGALSSVLDNAPTYAAFAAFAKGLSVGQPGLVNGILPLKLAAVSAGSVVMGATTYIGNGPNLMVKAIAERANYVLPSFARYAGFALLTMLIPHLLMTAAFMLLER
jgi:Na+/H+ antiporter NhaD/arsenite permease-like protein